MLNNAVGRERLSLFLLVIQHSRNSDFTNSATHLYHEGTGRIDDVPGGAPKYVDHGITHLVQDRRSTWRTYAIIAYEGHKRNFWIFSHSEFQASDVSWFC